MKRKNTIRLAKAALITRNAVLYLAFVLVVIMLLAVARTLWFISAMMFSEWWAGALLAIPLVHNIVRIIRVPGDAIKE